MTLPHKSFCVILILNVLNVILLLSVLKGRGYLHADWEDRDNRKDP